jgi:hypothetical protein
VIVKVTRKARGNYKVNPVLLKRNCTLEGKIWWLMYANIKAVTRKAGTVAGLTSAQSVVHDTQKDVNKEGTTDHKKRNSTA